jgi:Co/Zn/Cd efflux system component
VSGQHHDINLQAAFLLMVDDVGISLAVVLGGLLVLWQELPSVDPVLCLLVASFIIFKVGTYPKITWTMHWMQHPVTLMLRAFVSIWLTWIK